MDNNGHQGQSEIQDLLIPAVSSVLGWQSHDGWKKGLLYEVCKLKANKKMANKIEAGKIR